jgi:phospholipid/cholesterol/gamma-HCH transport system ATP-binding protein
LKSLEYRDLQLYRGQIGFVFEESALIANKTIYDNIALPIRYHSDWNEKYISTIVNGAIAEMAMEKYSQMRPMDIPVVERKKAAILRAVAGCPPVLCFDNPSFGISFHAKKSFARQISNLTRAYKNTLIMATDDLPLALEMCERFVVIEGGRIILDGGRKEILASRSETVTELLEGETENIRRKTA